MSDLNQFKCPCCGGTLEFDVNSQNVTCPYCDAQFSMEELKQLDQNLQEKYEENMEWSDEDKAMFSDEETQGMHIYHCDSCGGEIICDENTASTSCPYCGNAVVMKGNLSGDLKPSLIIPFQLDVDKAKESLKSYFKKQFFIPGAFRKENQVQEIKTMYVPYFIYFADSSGKVLFDAEEHRSWSDSNYDYEETKYYRIYRYGDIAFDNIPVDASSKLADDLLESIEPFDVNQHKEFISAYLAGYTAERYDVDKSVTQQRANERIRQGTINALRGTIHGYDSVSVHESHITLSNQSSKYVLYPLFFLNVKWKENQYTFAVNGETGKSAGRYPISKGKVIAVLSIVFAIVAAISFGFGMLATEEIGLSIIIALIATILVTTIVGISLGKHLKKRVSFQNGAANYVRPNSFNLTYSRDQFLYRKVTKTRRAQSSSSNKRR